MSEHAVDDLVEVVFPDGRVTKVEIVWVPTQGGRIDEIVVNKLRGREPFVIEFTDLIDADALERRLTLIAQEAHPGDYVIAKGDRGLRDEAVDLLDPARTGRRPLRVTVGAGRP